MLRKTELTLIRSWLASLALSLMSALLCLLVLEAGIRLYSGVPLLSTENFVSAALDAMRRPGVSKYDSKLGWVQESNISLNKPFGFTTGEIGERMPNETVRPLAQNAVLAIGDSLTVGSEVGNSDSWPAQLEKMIGTQVINAATGGYSMDQTVLRTEALVQRLRPHTVLVQTIGITNLYNGLRVYGGAPKPYFRIEDGKLALYNEPVPRLATQRSDLGILRSVLGHSYLMHYVVTRLDKLQWWVSAPLRYQWATSTDEAMRISCLLMKRLATMRDQNNLRLAVVIQYGGTEPIDPRLGWDRAMLVDCMRKENITIVDAYDALKEVYQRDGEAAYKRLWVMHDNGRAYGHMSAAGNQLIAKLIAETVFAESRKQSSNQ